MKLETYYRCLASRLLFFLPAFAEFGSEPLNESGELMKHINIR